VPSEITNGTRPDPDRVVLLHDYSEALGGASYLVQVLIGQLRARGIPVTFIAGDRGHNFQRNDVEFLPLGGSDLLSRSRLDALTTGLYFGHARSQVGDWIARNDTPRTVYHLHGWSKILTPAVFAALRRVAPRLILHAHDYFNCCPNGAFFNYRTEEDCPLVPLSAACLRSQCDKAGYGQKLWRSAREGLRRGLQGGLANANRMVLIHPGQADNFRLGQWPAAKLCPVRNPVTPPCTARVAAEANRSVLFIGRISAEKGADLAARATAKAGLPITFVGDGDQMEQIRALNPDATFLGRQDRAGVARALAEARIAVMPSRWSEPFGLVALEAIGSGVPVVVSNRALMAHEIAQCGFGVAADTSDIDAFAAALSRLSADDAQMKTMSEAGHARYLDLCNTEESWTDAIMGHYRDVIASAPKA